MGFEKDIITIVQLIDQKRKEAEEGPPPYRRQNLLISATLRQNIERLASISLNQSARVFVDENKLEDSKPSTSTSTSSSLSLVRPLSFSPPFSHSLTLSPLTLTLTTPSHSTLSFPQRTKAEQSQLEILDSSEVENYEFDMVENPGLDTSKQEELAKSEAGDHYQTPSGLKQLFVIVELRRRLVTLISFLTEHLKYVLFFPFSFYLPTSLFFLLFLLFLFLFLFLLLLLFLFLFLFSFFLFLFLFFSTTFVSEQTESLLFSSPASIQLSTIQPCLQLSSTL
jgi:hypothetical protein